jgi:DNA-3-methyladenine glycosylase
MNGKVLPRDFYDRDVISVAQELLGKRLVREIGSWRLVGRIVEVEAYLADGDPANHAFRGKTGRNASMFGPPGHAYVYPIHSRHCLNAVTEPAGVASAVLIRAIEPIEGIERMQQNRGSSAVRDLARGPGRLCQALGIDRTLDGWDLTIAAKLWIDDAPNVAIHAIASRRIGVSSGADLLLRYYLPDCPFVSGPRLSRRAVANSADP